jgi:hypothetical protein
MAIKIKNLKIQLKLKRTNILIKIKILDSKENNNLIDHQI